MTTTSSPTADPPVDADQGLTSAEAAQRLTEHGPNRLASAPRRSSWLRFADQFRSTIVLILIGAAVLSAIVGDLKDPIVIGVVLVINAILGFIQEGRAENAMAVLEQMLVTRVKVRRDGEVVEIDAEQLVPGDLVLLDAGDRVPADGRFAFASSVSVDESALTGESLPVDKTTDPIDLPEGAGLGDRRNDGFMNTTVVRGRGELVVVATGMGTEMGKVAALLQSADPGPTPLQRQLDQLGKRLAVIAVVAVSAVFAVRLLQGDDFAEAAVAAVALAVAAIPEGLPAVVTVTLAVGMRQMAVRRAIVKRLSSVETLGSTSVICSDKTGTLTLNEMTTRTVVRGGTRLEVSGHGYDPTGELTLDGAPAVVDVGLRRALVAGAVCNEAVLRDGGLVGDPTEGAFVVLASKAGIDVDAERANRPRVGEVPFDSATKIMATFHRDGEHVDVFVKGAPDVLLERSAHAVVDGAEVPVDHAVRARLADDNRSLATQGLRVLAIATRRLPAADVLDADGMVDDPDRWVADLSFEALIGIVDPPRPEARDAIRLCGRAGISVKMITGDHAETARAIAADLGITGDVVSGAELDAMSDGELAARIEGIGVCARVSPEHKVRVVQALQSHGLVVAMTGDGVNDAAALRTADIGVAMGITGTEVTKEAADLILTDDDFATIVTAVERGRTIYDNITTFVRFQLSTAFGAILTLLAAGIAGLPSPFTAVQVLFVNLIADGPPAMTLGVDPPAPGVMDRSPRPADSQILTVQRALPLVGFAIVMMIGTLGLFSWAEPRYGEEVALTMTFTTFVLFQVVNALNVRTGDASVFSRYIASNPKLLIALGLVVAVQVAVVQLPFLQGVFDTTALAASQWAACAAVALSILVVDEVRKAVVRARS